MSVMNDHEINNSGFSSLMIISGLRCPWCPAMSRVPGEQAPRRRSPRHASICRWTASRFSLGAVWSGAEKVARWTLEIRNFQVQWGYESLWYSIRNSASFHDSFLTSPGPKWSKMVQNDPRLHYRTNFARGWRRVVWKEAHDAARAGVEGLRSQLSMPTMRMDGHFNNYRVWGVM